MPNALSPADFKAAAETWDVEAAALRAVAAVESAGSGFIGNGKRPKILFEGHVFWKRLKHHGHDPEDLSDPQHGSILYRKWTHEHYSGKRTRDWKSVDLVPGYDEYDRLERARAIDPSDTDDSAFESCSWGKFQVMGYHWEDLEYGSLGEFLQEMHRGEDAHLEACLRFCRKNKTRDGSGRNLIEALRDEDWAAFARAYNGPGYAKNAYDTKLARAFARHQ